LNKKIRKIRLETLQQAFHLRFLEACLCRIRTKYIVFVVRKWKADFQTRQRLFGLEKNEFRYSIDVFTSKFVHEYMQL